MTAFRRSTAFTIPPQHRRSLGTWSILWLVEECRRAGLALRLSRLLDRREPEDGLQGALPGARTPDGRGLDADLGQPEPSRFLNSADMPLASYRDGWPSRHPRRSRGQPSWSEVLSRQETMAAVPDDHRHPQSTLFGDMFGTAAMRAAFGEPAFIVRCVEVEAALARAQARLGIVPTEAAAAISACRRRDRRRTPRPSTSRGSSARPRLSATRSCRWCASSPSAPARPGAGCIGARRPRTSWTPPWCCRSATGLA